MLRRGRAVCRTWLDVLLDHNVDRRYRFEKRIKMIDPICGVDNPPGESRRSGAAGMNEFGHQLDMRRPDELVDRLDAEETIAAGDQDAGIAREARGVA